MRGILGANQLRQTLEALFLSLDLVMMDKKTGVLFFSSLMIAELVSNIFQVVADRVILLFVTENNSTLPGPLMCHLCSLGTMTS